MSGTPVHAKNMHDVLADRHSKKSHLCINRFADHLVCMYIHSLKKGQNVVSCTIHVAV